MPARFVSLTEAVAAIPDAATVATDGFTLMGVAEAVFAGIEASYRERGHPCDLTLVHASGQSNRSVGFEHFAVEGLARRVVGSHWGLMPKMCAFLGEGSAEAVCLPQGQMSALYRAIAAGRPGIVSKIGLGTFVDPLHDGGKLNDPAKRRAPDYVERLALDGEDLLFYRAFPIDVGIIRATSVDELGNCSQEEEAVNLDALAIAQAAHNSGGIVICQAKRLAPSGTLAPKQVCVPGCLVDFVVIASEPGRDHRQTDSTVFDPVYLSSGNGAVARTAHGPEDTTRMAIGRRAVRFLRQGDIVNIGTGIPGDAVGPALAEAGMLGGVTLTVESGTYDGIPAGGTDFGVAAGPSAIIPHAAQFDFYDGGGLDATFMGVGQVDAKGNVNVSRLGRKLIGCGGFIDITQSAKRVYFCFAFDSPHAKFVRSVDHLTFSADQARTRGQEVYYITERAVFQLRPAGLGLVEVSPGLDPARDVVDLLPFPVETGPLREAEAYLAPLGSQQHNERVVT
ncbi:MAG: CoA-transferase [Acidimicrobiales bacterium]